jgi:hypothetical protein
LKSSGNRNRKRIRSLRNQPPFVANSTQWSRNSTPNTLSGRSPTTMTTMAELRVREAVWSAKTPRESSSTGSGGCTRGEVRSRRGAPARGLAGQSDAAGLAPAPGNAGAAREGRVLRKYAVGRDCNAAATTTEFVADAPRSKAQRETTNVFCAIESLARNESITADIYGPRRIFER